MVNIVVKSDVKADLDLIKLCKDESYNSVISRLIENLKQSNE